MAKAIRRTAVVVMLLCGLVIAMGPVRGVYYAGSSIYFGITDGALVIPWPLFQEPSWGNWGWWTQEPWGESFDYYFTFFNSGGPSFVAPSVALPAWPVFMATYVPLVTRFLLRRKPNQRRALKWIGNASWVFIWLGAVAGGWGGGDA